MDPTPGRASHSFSQVIIEKQRKNTFSQRVRVILADQKPSLLIFDGLQDCARTERWTPKIGPEAKVESAPGERGGADDEQEDQAAA
jgi:hypothetical protein